MFFERAGAIDIATDDRADLGIIADCRHTGSIPQRRGREAGSIGFLGEFEDCDGVCERTGDRFVDKHGLMRLEDRPCLFQMGPAVDTLQEYDVDVRQQLIDRANDRHAILVAQFAGKSGNAITAGGNVWAASRIGRHDAHARKLGLWVGTVQ